jgi:hypothetical protein
MHFSKVKKSQTPAKEFGIYIVLNEKKITFSSTSFSSKPRFQ